MAEKRLMERIRDEIRLRHFSIRNEQAYIHWIIKFINYHGKTYPGDMAEKEVKQFLTHLAVDRLVSASTQHQALNAIVFLYKNVLNKELGDISGARRAHKKMRAPVVLTKAEMKAVLDALPYPYKLIARMQYVSGARLIEALRLRVKDLDFERLTVIIRGKGDKDRISTLSKGICAPLQEHLRRVKKIHEQDLKEGYGAVYLPPAMQRSMPRAAKDWIWQYVFPSPSRSVDPRSNITRRHHIHIDSINKQIRAAAKLAGIDKHVSSHAFRHSFATHLIEANTPIQTVQQLLGHASIETTKIYLHAMRKPGAGLQSPEDL